MDNVQGSARMFVTGLVSIWFIFIETNAEIYTNNNEHVYCEK